MIAQTVVGRLYYNWLTNLGKRSNVGKYVAYETLFASAGSGPAQPPYIYGTVFINLFNNPVRSYRSHAQSFAALYYIQLRMDDAILVDDVMISPSTVVLGI